MYNVAILLPSLDYRNNTSGTINKASIGILWEQISWLITVLLVATLSIFSIKTKIIWILAFLPPILFDFIVVIMGLNILKSTLNWCLMNDILIRLIHISGLLVRGISLTLMCLNICFGFPSLMIPLALMFIIITFQVICTSCSNSLRCPWIILRFLFVDIWIGLLCFQIFLRITAEQNYYNKIDNNMIWTSQSYYHENIVSIAQKFHHIPSWWIVFWPCWFWCGTIFAFSTVFCLFGISDRLLTIVGLYFGGLATFILITCIDLAEYLNQGIILKDNKEILSFPFIPINYTFRLWHISLICTQVFVTIFSAFISQSFLEGRTISNEINENQLITNTIKMVKKSKCPYIIGSSVTLNKKGTGIFHTIEAKYPYSYSDEITFNISTMCCTSPCNSITSKSDNWNEDKYSTEEINLEKRDQSNNDEIFDLSCMICYDNKVEAVFLACGHGGLCTKCALREFYRVGLCPTCRQATQAIVVYNKNKYIIKDSQKIINATVIATQDI
ncbi:hypothetical protein cand_005400 [Cryptosporidium andersoni]|uniref:RING-type domain-containing protein n=1 Tax=Cryptosporidium andersoni TaxID=117008 RepID=A0A1J4MJN2_9CRYT|nr:hypothetical protein cand_005400 [Cryptosporidium andersoni]